jgi:hypothetical protein
MIIDFKDLLANLTAKREVMKDRAEELKMAALPANRTIPDDPTAEDPVEAYLETLPNSREKNRYYIAVIRVEEMDRRIAKALERLAILENHCHAMRENHSMSMPKMPPI